MFKKAIDILNLSQTICDVLPERKHAEVTPSLMMGNTNTVTTKIKGTMAAHDVYSLVMENAVIIKVNMGQLKDWLWACEAIHNVEERYVDVLKNEIKTFKKIFIQWVGSFNKKRDLPYEWHLFNGPANFPDDYKPFDARDFSDNSNPDDD